MNRPDEIASSLSRTSRVRRDPGIRDRTTLNVPIRQVTTGPRAHWFGYYDIAAFDSTGDRLLACASDFEWRAPSPSDALEIGVIDLADRDRFTPLGTSRSWGWQHACLLQWRPGYRDDVVWNDRIGDARITRITDVRSGVERILDTGFYALSPDGNVALGCDLDRLEWMRPGYGCSALHVHRPTALAPQDSGVTRVDLNSGERKLLVSLAELQTLEPAEDRGRGCWHYVNHLSFSPDGRYFAAIHRWRRNLWTPRPYRAMTGFGSRLVVGSLDGSGLRVVDPSGRTSHFAWRSPSQIVAWTRPRGERSGLFVIDIQTGSSEHIPGFIENGHHSYLTLPGRAEPEWMLNDTYPKPSRLRQELYLVHLATGRRYDLGSFAIAGLLKFGETRCDLHPRFSPTGDRISFDSAHSGRRQMYVAELSDFVRSFSSLAGE